MKTNQITRIEEFIDSLRHEELISAQQAIVLQAEQTVIGGANSRCNNSGSSACLSSNDVCTNHGICTMSNKHCSAPGPPGPGGNP